MAFVSSFAEDHGYAPTLREICEACDVPSTSGASFHMGVLERQGLIVRGPRGKSRTWCVADRAMIDQHELAVRIARVGLAWAAIRDTGHLLTGFCPDSQNPTDRDPQCPACVAMKRMDEELKDLKKWARTRPTREGT